MSDSAREKVAAALAMVACCGLSMSLALGLVAFSSTLVLGGVGLAVVIGCVVFMAVFGHRHRREVCDDTDAASASDKVTH